MNIYDFSLKNIDGTETSLGDYRGKALLVVNVASRCGLTPQYTALEALHQDLKGRGFEVLGFPCNQFGAQEPGSEAEIKEFCSTQYDVTFPLFSKIDVNGKGRHPLYEWLTSQATKPDGAGDIPWNFTKFVIGKDGEIAARFSPKPAPDDPELKKAIERALG